MYNKFFVLYYTDFDGYEVNLVSQHSQLLAYGNKETAEHNLNAIRNRLTRDLEQPRYVKQKKMFSVIDVPNPWYNKDYINQKKFFEDMRIRDTINYRLCSILVGQTKEIKVE
ncbi:MAG: hypothetical protein ACRCWQ_10940 [Bacilli bacterium]